MPVEPKQGQGLMKKVVLSAVAAVAVSASTAFAADLTGVLRVTYTLKTFIFNLGDADAAIRDAVLKFAEEKGYFKYRVYPEEDDVRYFQETRTTRYKKFFILYDKNRLE